MFQDFPLSLHRFLTESAISLGYGVMVAQQVLVLFVQVRILVVQQRITQRIFIPFKIKEVLQGFMF